VKLNELQQEVHGNRLGAGLAGFKDRMLGRATGQQSTTERVAQTEFIKNFVGSASSAIQTAINSGLVSPTSVQPAEPAQAPVVAPPQQKPIDPYAAKRAAAAQAAQAGMTPVPPKAQPGAAAFDNMAKTVTQPARPSFADRAGGKTRAKIASRKQSHLKENYDALNAIFESIMEAGEPVTISSYLQRFFTQHMHGVDTTDETAQIKKLCDAAQQTWGRDQGKQALTQLANLGWSISFTNAGKAPSAQSKAAPAADSQSMGGSFMAGMKGQSSIPPETSAASNTDEPETPITSILHQIDQLKKTDKRAYAQLIQQLMP
jgi:hypothetical protein